MSAATVDPPFADEPRWGEFEPDEYGAPRAPVNDTLPAHDLEAERAVLSAVMLDPAAFDKVRDLLRPEHFFSEAHRRIFEACTALASRGEPLDVTTVGTWLREQNRLAQVGGVAYLTELLNAAPAVGNVVAYARGVLSAWQSRELRRLRQTTDARLAQPGADAEHILSIEQDELTKLGAARRSSTPGGDLRARLVRVDASWITDEPPPLTYLVRDSRTGRGAIEAQGTGLLVAAGSSGKGFASLSLGLAVSTGTPWLGCMTVERRGRVLFVSAEDRAKTHLRYRIHTMARAMGIAELGENFDILDVCGQHLPMLTPEGIPGRGMDALVGFVHEHGPYALVVLDPISRIAGASIDADNVAATALIGTFEAISAASGGFVLGCHHTSLAARRSSDTSTTGIRGATGLGDSARIVMTLSIEKLAHGDPDLNAHLGELVTLRPPKVNHVREWEPIVMRRAMDGALVPLDESDAVMVEAAREKADPGQAKRAKHETQREATLDTRAQKDARRRVAKAEATEAARRRQDDEDDAAARLLRAEHPETVERNIIALLMKARACGGTRAHHAIVRTRPATPATDGEATDGEATDGEL